MADRRLGGLPFCAVYDKLMSFEPGIDDYAVKSFSVRELMARVKAVLAKHTEVKPKQEVVIQGIRIDTTAHEVFVDGERTYLTAKEYKLWLFLFSRCS